MNGRTCRWKEMKLLNVQMGRDEAYEGSIAREEGRKDAKEGERCGESRCRSLFYQSDDAMGADDDAMGADDIAMGANDAITMRCEQQYHSAGREQTKEHQ